MLSNKTIVITGGTSGIGYQLTSLLQRNNKVIVIARNTSKLEQLSNDFSNVFTYPANLSKVEEYESVVDTIINDHKHIDILINNAAVQNTPEFTSDNFSYDKMFPEIQLNFSAVCALSYLFLPCMLNSSNKCQIVNMNSGLGLAPKKGSAVYCATKGAMNIFSQSLGYQLEETNIDVSQVILPLVDTPMTEGRGSGKLSAKKAAEGVISGVENGKTTIYIGKAKLLRILMIVAPWLAKKILKSY